MRRGKHERARSFEEWKRAKTLLALDEVPIPYAPTERGNLDPNHRAGLYLLTMVWRMQETSLPTYDAGMRGAADWLESWLEATP